MYGIKIPKSINEHDGEFDVGFLRYVSRVLSPYDTNSFYSLQIIVSRVGVGYICKRF